MRLFVDADVGNNEIFLMTEILEKGGIGIWKTDTIYGIFCRFDSINSIKNILGFKGRSKVHKFSVALHQLEPYLDWFDITPPQAELMKKTLPGALTYIVPLKSKVPSQWFNKDDYLGIRIPAHNLTIKICEALQIPLITTSANKSGSPNIKSIKEISGSAKQVTDFIVDSGTIEQPVASTIVRFENNSYSIIREGQYESGRIVKIWETVNEVDK